MSSTFEDAIAAAGFSIPQEIIWDGRLHRFPTDERKRGSKDGWYVAFDDSTGRAAAFGSWRANTSKTWSNGTNRKLTQSEIDRVRDMKKAAEEAMRSDKDKAAILAQSVYAGLSKGKSAYIERKKIQWPNGVRFGEFRSVDLGMDKDFSFRALAVPVMNMAGVIRSLQFIRDDGGKFFLPGGEVKGCFFVIGNIMDASHVVLCEGLSTGASIHEAVGWPVVVAFSAGNLGPVYAALKKQHPTAEIAIAADNDTKTEGNPGLTAARALGGKVVYVEGGGDFNDLHVSAGLEAVRGHFVQETPWRMGLITKETEQGGQVVVKCSTNFALILENSPEWRGVLSLDEFSQRIIPQKKPPIPMVGNEWQDHHVAETKMWLEAKEFRSAIPTALVQEAVTAVAARNPSHQVRQYLDRLEWDGVERVASFLCEAAGAEDSEYVRAVSSSMLISAVARIYKPGCKVDTTLVLEGEQGLRKSSMFVALFSPTWHSEITASVTDKDFYQNMRGKWCLEFADLKGMSGADRNHLKQILTATSDNYRPSYARQNQDFPRQNIFVATTNDDKYLNDPTGARRFLPVRATAIALDYVNYARDQIWAEAVYRFRAGESWWEIPSDAAISAQEDRYETDPWESLVAKWLDGQYEGFVSVADVLTRAVEVPTQHQDARASQRVVKILRKLGWQSHVKKVEKRPLRGWKRPD